MLTYKYRSTIQNHRNRDTGWRSSCKDVVGLGGGGVEYTHSCFSVGDDTDLGMGQGYVNEGWNCVIKLHVILIEDELLTNSNKSYQQIQTL